MNRNYFVIYAIISFFSGIMATGCTDEELLPSSDAALDPDAITFSARALAAGKGMTRGADRPLYEPLELKGERDETTLYLHTYDSPKIGFIPGEGVFSDESSGTRGYQVNSATDLSKFHEKFKVHATKKDSSDPYIVWAETSLSDVEENIWRTYRTSYWPSDESLTFYAVSPSTARDNLEAYRIDDGEISFDFSPLKGDTDMDAEMQYDLLLASTECKKSESLEGTVPLEFHHALSAIKFAIRDVLDGEVVNIKLSGIRAEGHCDFAKDEEGSYGFQWSDIKGTATYSQNFGYEIKGDRYVDPDDDTQDIVLNDLMPSKTFMVIPQEIPDDAEVIVTLKRSHVAEGEDEEITVKGKIIANNLTAWEPGHEYVYTISTTKDNWVYRFEVKGNEAEGYDNIYVYSPNNDNFHQSENRAYYSVVSCRYRANDMTDLYELPWEATFEGSESYKVEDSNDILINGKWIDPDKWITDTNANKFHGDGGLTPDIHDIELYPHYLDTDWPGDKIMQGYEPYKESMNEKDTPYDLSTFGGSDMRNTANCYVLDRGGWYSFPLVYGNAVKNGGDNLGAYTCNGSAIGVLTTLTDYNGNEISGGYISGGKSATLVWQDAYNMVSEVELVRIGGEDMIRFYVDKENLQQGNAVIALKNEEGLIMWSWHIWATEHWLDSSGRPNALSSSGEFNFRLNDITKIREKGDAEITLGHGMYKFRMAPYNLGWCDPKDVYYLKRKSRMDFIQYTDAEKSEVRASASLPIIQNGETVRYKVGNNTYYQWGRKDPQVGFVDHNKNYKANFGPTPFGLEGNEWTSITSSIRRPYNMFVHLDNNEPNGHRKDWAINSHINLWNNREDVRIGNVDDDEGLYLARKTVYDPSPVGYMVPNAGVWNILADYDSEEPWDNVTDMTWNNDPTFGGHFNGEVKEINEGYVYVVYGNGNKDSKENRIYLVPTGNRWYSNGHKFTQEEGTTQEINIAAGLNFNLRVFYGWSSRWSNHNDYSAFCGAVGIDAQTGYNYYLKRFFYGNRAMARPIRSIRETE